MEDQNDNQDNGLDRGRLSVPALAMEYTKELSERTGMTRAEIVMIAIRELREKLLAA